MKLLKVFGKESQRQSIQNRVQALLDPMEPLVVTEYPRRAGRPMVLTDANIIQIMQWKAAGMSNCEIGRRLHVSEATVRRYLKPLQPTSLPVDQVLELSPKELVGD